MRFDTKLAVVLRDDLAVWQKLNVTAFLVSGIAATVPDVVGPAYEDASGQQYLPMFVQPVLVFSANAEQLRVAFERACVSDTACAIFSEELFATGYDEANRAAVQAIATNNLNLVGMAFRTDRKAADKIVKGLSLHP
ncbi:MAG: DUF2000 family protein [Roseiflexaceae bacterium]|nr:DUF2000 family protein [Roseiflexaceae bacterium]